MALTCGEETTYAFNGAEWLAKNKPDLIAAEFALNEGGGGRLDEHGKRQVLAVQVGEKAAQNYHLRRRPIPAATARSRCPTTRSTSSPTR